MAAVSAWDRVENQSGTNNMESRVRCTTTDESFFAAVGCASGSTMQVDEVLSWILFGMGRPEAEVGMAEARMACGRQIGNTFANKIKEVFLYCGGLLLLVAVKSTIPDSQRTSLIYVRGQCQ